MLPTIFERNGTGFVVDKFNSETLWVFSEPIIARRLYNGVLLKLDKRGWQFISGRKVDHSSGESVAEWHKIFPKATLGQLLRKQFPESPFSYIEAFEDAQLLFPEMTYDNGFYTLVGYGIGETEEPALIPLDQAEQLSDINSIDFTQLDTGETFKALQSALAPMRDSVHGVLFSPQAGDGRRAQLLVTDFDWDGYDD